jgi:nucleotide-binding universal stress UspA family protein
MPKLILLALTGSGGDGPAEAAAIALGQAFGAHLIGLHVQRDVRQDIAALASADMGMATGLDGIMERMEQEAATREKDAERTWRDACDKAAIPLAEQPNGPTGAHTGATYEFAAETGEESEWVAEYGRAADLVVVGRVREGEMLDLDAMEAALMNTGKPVLIPADRAGLVLDGTIAIAWKNTAEAAGAVAAALPFIRRAKRVIVFSVEEDEAADSVDKSHLRLVRALRWHNANTGSQVLRRDSRPPVGVLLDALAREACDMLVMGGYGHTRLREAVFGGFTRAVLEAAPLPVLMAH